MPNDFSLSNLRQVAMSPLESNADNPPGRGIADIPATRQAIYDRALHAAKNLPPFQNSQYTIKLTDAGYEGPESFTKSERKKALLTGDSLTRRLRGTLEMSETPTGKVLDSRKITLAAIPHLTDDGVYVLNGADYSLAHQARLRPGIFVRRMENGEIAAHCLHYTTKIWTELGLLPIGKIVNEKMQTRVWSYDFSTKQFVLKNITGWFRNPVKNGLGRVRFEAPGRLPALLERSHPLVLWATPEHKVFSPDGSKLPISESSVLTLAENAPTSTQQQLVYGSLLGDAHITSAGLYHECHGVAQRAYLEFKGEILKYYLYSPIRDINNGGNAAVLLTTKAWSFFYKMRELCYVDGVKTITQEFLDVIDERGLAIWFGDDGCAIRAANSTHQTNCVSINLATQCFKRSEIDLLLNWLQVRWNLRATANRNEKTYANKDMGWYILIGGSNGERFLDLITPYLHPSLHYKLPGRPITSKCLDCGKEITRRHKTCNRCVAIGKEIRHKNAAFTRFGSSRTLTAPEEIANIPPDINPGEHWDKRMQLAGKCISEMEADNKIKLVLNTVPCKFEMNKGLCLEKTGIAYDIEIEDTHNYFANGVLVSNCNVSKGFGHHVLLDPATGVFRLNMAQSKIPLYPILHALGVEDQALNKAWGQEVLDANKAIPDRQAMDKLAKKLLRKPGATTAERHQQVLDQIKQMTVDPEVTQKTLGKAHSTLSGEAYTDATRKMLAVSRNEAETDDRDHPAFMRLLGPEDLIAERIEKAPKTLYPLFWRATAKKNLDPFLPGFLNKAVKAVFQTSGLAQPLEETSSLEVLGQLSRITRLGEGGIRSSDAIPDSSRNVHPAQLGYIDTVFSPECYDEKTEVMTFNGWKLWRDITYADKLACLVNKRLEFHSPSKLIAEKYVGPMYGSDLKSINYLVTPNHRMLVRDGFQPYKAWQIEKISDCHAKFRRHRTGGHLPWIGNQVESYSLPEITKRAPNTITQVADLNPDDWCEFMGWFLSEGDTVFREDKHRYQVRISQDLAANPDNYHQIQNLLTRLPFKYTAAGNKRIFIIASRILATYCKQFGGWESKYIPDDLLSAPESARKKLLEALLLGDGRKQTYEKRKGESYALCTGSEALAISFEQLAFSLGYSCRIAFEPEKRFEHYKGTYVVYLLRQDTRLVRNNGSVDFRTKRVRNNQYIIDYSGMVYCATVPGSLLYVRRENGLGFWCGNSESAGVDTRAASHLRKGEDGRMYAPYIDPRTGKKHWLSAQEVANKVIAIPGEMQKDSPQIAVINKGKIGYVPKKEVDYVLEHMEPTFNHVTNLVALKSASKGQRVSMGSRMLTQSLPPGPPQEEEGETEEATKRLMQAHPLSGAQAPYVQTGVPGMENTSYHELYGKHVGAVFAHGDKGPGVVTKVTPEEIEVKYRDKRETYGLHHWTPNNRKTPLHNEASVSVGEQVKPGQLLARSNFTDEKGVVASGRNLHTAYIPYLGESIEDAVVVSEDAALKKLVSQHAYKHQMDFDDKTKVGKHSFISLFPSKFDRKMLDPLDEDGIIKPGTKVTYGQPLILGAKERERGEHQVTRGKGNSYSDVSLTWDHEAPGVVTDSFRTPSGAIVVTQSNHTLSIGDKLSGLYGNKGVVSKILPTDQMPHTKDGRPLDLLLNSLGLISRQNASQIIENSLGKVAEKTGVPYKIKDFGSIEDLSEFARQELKKHGMTAEEDLTDPTTGRKIPSVQVGQSYILKLHHTSESKSAGRAMGGYSAEGEPARGGPLGSKRYAMMHTAALLSHGALGALKDVILYRGQSNPDMWADFLTGKNPREPKTPQVHEKFYELLKASGINPVAHGPKINVMALTNKAINELTENRELKNAELVDWKGTLSPVPGGLFDKTLTGSHGGRRWSAINLHEPLPNPIFEDAIKKVLSLTTKKFNDILTGRELYNNEKGPLAIRNALEKIDIDKAINSDRELIKHSRGARRDAAIKRLRILKGAEAQEVHPSDWFWDKVPVLPPMFRQVNLMQGSGLPLIADANLLYKDLFDANSNLKDMKGRVDDVSAEREATYHALKAVVGMGEPITPKNKERGVKGALELLLGNSPKHSFMQSRILGRPVDLVGRSVVTPNADYSMDDVGIPEESAWNVYRPFIIRRLVRRGAAPLDAAKQAEDRTVLAKRMMLDEMKERPVIMDRAPVLHRYGVMAFWPKLAKGHQLVVNPFILKGMDMDFDGDTVNYHVPFSLDAVKDAIHKLLPSKNLFSVKDFHTHQLPMNEFKGGIYLASAIADIHKSEKIFRTLQDVIDAYMQGEVNHDSRILVHNQ